MRWWGLGLLGVVLTAGWFWMGRSLSDGRSVVVSRGPVEGLMTVPGWIEPVGGVVEVSTHVPGTIASIPVVPGQLVAAGDIIATLGKDEAAAKVSQARASVSQAEANVRALEAILKSLDNQARAAASEAARQKSEQASAPPPAEGQKSDAPSASALLNDPVALEKEARRLLNSLMPSQLPALLSNPESRREALASAQAAVQLAQGQLDEATTFENYKVVRAPSAGTVVRVLAEVGEQTGGLMAGPLVGLADLSRLQVRIEVDEADVTRIQPGLKAYVTTPATGEQRFTATVTQVSAEMGRRKVPLDDPRARIDTRVLEAVLTLDQPGPFKLSQRVTAHIVLTPEASVLRVPVTALFHLPSQAPDHPSRLEPFVRRAGSIDSTLVPVTLGRSDGVWVEVLSGVEEGQTLLLDPAIP